MHEEEEKFGGFLFLPLLWLVELVRFIFGNTRPGATPDLIFHTYKRHLLAPNWAMTLTLNVYLIYHPGNTSSGS